MSDNLSSDDEIDLFEADLVTVGTVGTARDFLEALDGGSALSTLRAAWLDRPEEFARYLIAEILRRDRHYDEVVTDIAALEIRVEEQDVAIQTAQASFENLGGHYSLALAVCEAAAAYIAVGDDTSLPARFDVVADALSAFDAFEGPVKIDAMAGGRVAVSAVPPYQGDTEDEASDDVPRPVLSVVRDGQEP